MCLVSVFCVYNHVLKSIAKALLCRATLVYLVPACYLPVCQWVFLTVRFPGRLCGVMLHGNKETNENQDKIVNLIYQID